MLTVLTFAPDGFAHEENPPEENEDEDVSRAEAVISGRDSDDHPLPLGVFLGGVMTPLGLPSALYGGSLGIASSLGNFHSLIQVNLSLTTQSSPDLAVDLADLTALRTMIDLTYEWHHLFGGVVLAAVMRSMKDTRDDENLAQTYSFAAGIEAGVRLPLFDIERSGSSPIKVMARASGLLLGHAPFPYALWVNDQQVWRQSPFSDYMDVQMNLGVIIYFEHSYRKQDLQ